MKKHNEVFGSQVDFQEEIPAMFIGTPHLDAHEQKAIEARDRGNEREDEREGFDFSE